jgi:hypothetical protein
MEPADEIGGSHYLLPITREVGKGGVTITQCYSAFPVTPIPQSQLRSGNRYQCLVIGRELYTMHPGSMTSEQE